MWMGTVNMNFFIISLARIELHSCAPLRPACFGALPSSRLGCALSGDGGRGEAPGWRGPAVPAGGGVRLAPDAAAASLQLATWLISSVLWLQGRGRFVSPGCPSDSCHRGRSFWEPPSEGETCGETGAKVVRGHPAQAAWARVPKGGFEKGHTTRHPPSPVHIRPPTQDTTAPHHTHTLALPSSPPWLPVAADARLSRGAPPGKGAQAPAPSPAPATWPSPRGSGPAPCAPPASPVWIFFFCFHS